MKEMTITIQEEERQLILMALAMLSMTRPGFDDALNRIALKIDNRRGGRGEMFDLFREILKPNGNSPCTDTSV